MKKKLLIKDIFTTCLSIVFSVASLSSVCENIQVHADEEMVPYLEYTFDNRLDGWQTAVNPRVGFDSENPHSGTSCLTVSNRLDNKYSVYITSYDMFSSGYKYKFSVYLFQETETDQVMYIAGRTQSGTEYNIATGTVPPNTWTEVTGESVIYETDPVISLLISTENGTIDYKMDDFVISRQKSAPAVKSLDNNDYSNQMSYQESVASQQKAAEEAAKSKETETEKVNETTPEQTSIQIISKEDKSSDKGFLIILIAGIAFALICFGISVVIVISRKKNKQPVTSSSIDSLTKFPNKTEYENAVLHLINNPDECSNMVVLICSVCFINYINDNYGTETGDLTLVRCANCLRKALGSDVKVYRSDGNEFMCFSDTSMIESVKKAIEEESKTDNGYPFACAVGEASYKENKSQNSNSDIRNTIMKADELMEQNKEKIVNGTHLGRHFPSKK